MDKITQRQIKGEFYKTLNASIGPAWVPQVSNLFTSDQASEEYAWLGMTPAMREWVGGRNAKGFLENSLTITNKHYEGTLEILKKDLRRDKTGQVMVRVRELARRTQSHWGSLLTTLILNGTSTTCYDGQYFFDTDHSEGSSGTQDNDITVDISAQPAATAGSTTAPSVEEMQWAIIKGVLQICSFKDDQGEPMNEDATDFLVMVPLTLYPAAIQAVSVPVQSGPTQLALKAVPQEFNIKVVPNVRIGTDWTASFAVFRTDSEIKSFIRQEETAVKFDVLGDGSDHTFKEDSHLYGVDAWRNVGYGYWQNACYVTMT